MSNLAQALVTVLVAVLVAAAALLMSAAAGDWQGGVRAELKRSAALVEDVRHVYDDEAPLALDLAFVEARESELRGGDAETERETIFALRQELPSDHLATARYDRSGQGFDVGRRLADMRQRHPSLVRLDPEASMANGDRRRRIAQGLLVCSLALVLLYLAVDLFVRRRGLRAPTANRRQVDVGLVPRPWSSPVARRPWAIVALIAWLLITLAPGLQIHYAGAEQRAQALGARKASEVSTLLLAGGLVGTFAANSRIRVVVMETHVLGRRLAAADSADPDEAAALRAAARTEDAVSERANIIATSMSRRPTARDGLDSATLQAIQATPRTADMRRMDQNREIVVAARAGRRANRVTLVIVVAGLAVSILALGATSAMSRRTPLDLAAGALLTLSLALLASVPFL